MPETLFPLNYKNNQLHLEEVPLSSIADHFGTPTYIYSRKALEDNYLAYRNALDNDNSSDKKHLVCYSVKANSNLGVLSLLAKLGSGFDIVSVGELERVIMAGGDPGKVVFSGVAKLEQEISRALEAGIHCFNVESATELERIAKVAESLNKTAPVSIRVNPDVDAKTHPYISTGLKENKFGIDINDAIGIYQHASKLSNIAIKGIDCHIGSQLSETQPFKDALHRVLELVDQLADQGINLEHIDVGGGLGVRYQDETPPQASDYIHELLTIMQSRPESLILEPGRSIAANAGVLITRVDTIKSNNIKNFAIVDAAMNDLIRPSLYEAWMDILPFKQNDNASNNNKHYDIVGPVCETGDFLGKNRALQLEEGDLLCINSAGAYGFVMSSNYNSRCRPAEVIIDGDSFQVVRTRESFKDLVRGESIFE